MKQIRRAAKDALFFQAEVGRLEKLLSQAGVESSKRSTIVTLRMEVFQLREAVRSLQTGKDAVPAASGGQIRLPKAVPAPKPGKDTAGALRREVASLTRQVRQLTRENARLNKALERSQKQKDEIAALRRKVAALLGRLKRAAKSSPPRRAGAQLRKALERARKQKDTIKALREEVGSLSRETRPLRREQERLQDLKATVRWKTVEAGLLRGELA